jgi:hypothetical protein
LFVENAVEAGNGTWALAKEVAFFLSNCQLWDREYLGVCMQGAIETRVVFSLGISWIWFWLGDGWRVGGARSQAAEYARLLLLLSAACCQLVCGQQRASDGENRRRNRKPL